MEAFDHTDVQYTAALDDSSCEPMLSGFTMASTGVAVGPGGTLWAMLAPNAAHLAASHDPSTTQVRIIGPLIMSSQGRAATPPVAGPTPAPGSAAAEADPGQQPLGAAAHHIQLAAAAAAAAASSAAAAAGASPLAQLGTPLRCRHTAVGCGGRHMSPSAMECLYEEGEALAALLSMSPAHRHLFVLEDEEEEEVAGVQQEGTDPAKAGSSSRGSMMDTLMFEPGGGSSSADNLDQELAVSAAAELATATVAVDGVHLVDRASAGSPAAAAAAAAGAGGSAAPGSSRLRHRRSTSGSAAPSGLREGLISPTPALALTPRTTKRRRLAPRRLRGALAAAAAEGACGAGAAAAGPSTLASSAAAAAAQCQQAAEEAAAAAAAAARAVAAGPTAAAGVPCPSSPQLHGWGPSGPEDLHKCAANNAAARPEDAVCCLALPALPAEGCGPAPGLSRSLSTPSHLSSSSSLAQQQAGAAAWEPPAGGAWDLLAAQQQGSQPQLGRATPTCSVQPAPAAAPRVCQQLPPEPSWDALGSSDGEGPCQAPGLAAGTGCEAPSACWVCEGGGSEAGCLACGRMGAWQQGGQPAGITPGGGRELLQLGSGGLVGGEAPAHCGGELGALVSPLGGGGGGCSKGVDLMEWLALEPAAGGGVF